MNEILHASSSKYFTWSVKVKAKKRDCQNISVKKLFHRRGAAVKALYDKMFVVVKFS